MGTRGTKSLLERKAENPEYRKRQEEGYATFKLEAQILSALEQKGWSYSQLADATQTSKSNICRDLKGGGLSAASLSRLHRIADALGMKFITLLIPQEQAQSAVPEMEALVRNSFIAASGEPEVKARASLPAPTYASGNAAGAAGIVADSRQAGKRRRPRSRTSGRLR